MARIVFVMAAAALMSLTAVSNGFSELDPAKFRFRFTASVLIDGAEFTATSVQEIRAWPVNVPGRGEGVVFHHEGQAALLEVPGKPAILFTVANRGGSLSLEQAWLEACGLPPVGTPEQRAVKIDAFDSPCSLHVRDAPLIVASTDLLDPSTLVAVAPDAIDRVMGGGAKITEIWLSPTEEPLSMGLPEHLPWLKANFDPATFKTITIATNSGRALTTNGKFFYRDR